jgi:hypothetical protein
MAAYGGFFVLLIIALLMVIKLTISYSVIDRYLIQTAYTVLLLQVTNERAV